MKRLLLDHTTKKKNLIYDFYLKHKRVSHPFAQYQHWSSKPGVSFGQPFNEKMEHLYLYFLIALDIGKAKLKNEPI